MIGFASRETHSVKRALCLSLFALWAVACVGCGNSIFGHAITIGGTVVVANVSGGAVNPTSTVVPNAKVWLEQQSHQASRQGGGTVTVENVIQMTQSDSSGKFQFGVVPEGTYEIVAAVASMPGNGKPSNATIATAIQQASSGGPNNLTIPLVAEAGNAAVIQGLFTTTSPSGQGATISYAGVQAFAPPGGGTVQALVPFFDGLSQPVPPAINTSLSPGTGCTALSTCPFGTNCACYQIGLPASNPVVGTANLDGTGYAVPAAGQAIYSMDAAATVIGGSAADCVPGELVSSSFAAGSGGTTIAPQLDFIGCS